MEVGDRKLKILQAIIQDFISTAEPVGSRTLAKKYNLGISSATIRNEMADLEELGYLQQPHTSAGRIPSDKGYRLYVDHLMTINKLAEIQKDAIRKSFFDSIGELEQAIQQTSKILSQMTKLTSIVMSPQFKQSKLKHIQLIPIDSRSILLLMVAESGIVKNTVIRINQNYTPKNLDVISQMLHHKLQGLTMGDITPKIVEQIKNEINRFNSVIEVIVPMLFSTLEELESVDLYLDGITNIFNLPEYNNVDKARDFMEMIAQKEYMRDLLINTRDGLDIVIGRENKRQEMQECSLITATYRLNGLVVGKIGVIGPTRMDYGHIVPVIDFITKNLTKRLDDSNG